MRVATRRRSKHRKKKKYADIALVKTMLMYFQLHDLENIII